MKVKPRPKKQTNKQTKKPLQKTKGILSRKQKLKTEITKREPSTKVNDPFNLKRGKSRKGSPVKKTSWTAPSLKTKKNNKKTQKQTKQTNKQTKKRVMCRKQAGQPLQLKMDIQQEREPCAVS